MKRQVIYMSPNCDYDWDEFLALPTDQEKLHVARNTNEMYIYSLDGFQTAFNDEQISDYGFIYFV